jgi:succinate dehydrogenase/fumarate reductase flavoprotein subunit
MEPFALSELEPEALTYLQRNGALQATPIERLAHMNRPAIDIYSENGIDITAEPLEIAVCAQHHNGGFVVDKWWQSTVPHTFVIGEMAGTHGVKRPGGAALNSGQVGGLRAAEYIAEVYGAGVADEASLGEEQRSQLGSLLDRLRGFVDNSSGTHSPREAISAIQRASSEAAAHLRELSRAERGLADARERLADVRAGLRISRRADLATAIQAEHLALTQVALLEAIVDYLKRGGGSRGSYMVLRQDGTVISPDLVTPDLGGPYRFVPENPALRDEITEIELRDPERAAFAFSRVKPRSAPRHDEPFEKLWTAFRSGDIYHA